MAATSTSRAMAGQKMIAGTEPSIRMAIIPVTSRTLSAMGSRTLPRFDTWLKWRAM